MKIGVYGSAAGVVDSVIPKAREIGKQIALNGHIVVTGACTGLPYEAVKGARSAGGKSIGYSPGKDLEDHKNAHGFPEDAADKIIFTGLSKKGRNVISVETSDASVFISGRMGTLNEFTIAYDSGKIIGVLTETGGVADMVKGIIERLKKSTKGVVIYESDPKKLIQKISEVNV
ncbi:hypothetical protein KY331_02625 [Candidatus Woesearchaeota archaeon]|nr:hypothetical protein [Candidatus Woesearchaeota archaeon]